MRTETPVLSVENAIGFIITSRSDWFGAAVGYTPWNVPIGAKELKYRSSKLLKSLGIFILAIMQQALLPFVNRQTQAGLFLAPP